MHTVKLSPLCPRDCTARSSSEKKRAFTSCFPSKHAPCSTRAGGGGWTLIDAPRPDGFAAAGARSVGQGCRRHRGAARPRRGRVLDAREHAGSLGHDGPRTWPEEPHLREGPSRAAPRPGTGLGEAAQRPSRARPRAAGARPSQQAGAMSGHARCLEAPSHERPRWGSMDRECPVGVGPR